MDLTIVETKEVPLLYRKEFTLRAYFDGPTKSRKELQTLVAKQVKADNTLVIIKKVDTTFGDKSAMIVAFVYDNPEMMKRIEGEYMIKRNTFAEEKKAEKEKPAAPAEEKPSASTEEKPVEEVQEKKTPKEAE